MSDARPNIIFILTDQQRADTLGCAGYDYMITPNLDRLGAEGVLFDRCFTQGGCCVPARASLFSGKYVHKHGRYPNGGWGGHDNWVCRLADGGYQTVNIGKMHMQPWRTDGGFEHRFVCENKNQPFGDAEPDEWVKHLASRGLERPLDYHEKPGFWDRLGSVDFPLPEDCHEDVFISAKTVEWIERRDDDRPLFLTVGFAGPHDPYDAPQRYKDLYAGRDVPAPRALPGELDTKPPEQRAYMDNFETTESCTHIRGSHFTPERLRRMREGYLGGVTLIDQQVGKILDSLRATGLLEDAIVIFTSDHGDALGDNEMVYKWFLYDSMTRVPMLVWGPKYFGPGRRDGLVELFDIGPTVLDLAGVSVPDEIQATSLAPLLTGGAHKPRDYVFCEEKNMVMVRSRDWKLVYYNFREHGELYDLTGDPHESRNLFDDPACQDRKAEMIVVMEDWYARTGGRHEMMNRYK